MRRNISILLLILIGISFLTGCSNKEALTKEEFIEKAKSNGYKTEDGIADLPEEQQEYYDSYTIAMPEDMSYRLEFGVFKEEETSKNFFENMKSMVELEVSKYTSPKTKDIANYQSYKIVSNEIYIVISRVGNTAIYGLVPEKYKNQLDDFLKDMDY